MAMPFILITTFYFVKISFPFMGHSQRCYIVYTDFALKASIHLNLHTNAAIPPRLLGVPKFRPYASSSLRPHTPLSGIFVKPWETTKKDKYVVKLKEGHKRFMYPWWHHWKVWRKMIKLIFTCLITTIHYLCISLEFTRNEGINCFIDKHNKYKWGARKHVRNG